MQLRVLAQSSGKGEAISIGMSCIQAIGVGRQLESELAKPYCGQRHVFRLQTCQNREKLNYAVTMAAGGELLKNAAWNKHLSIGKGV